VDKDQAHLDKHKWYKGTHGYAITGLNGKNVHLHHLVLPIINGLDVDHVSGDRLDCRASNLRHATRQQNNMNRRATKGYKGVYFNKKAKKYAATIHKDGKSIHLGLFIDTKTAAEAYNIAAKKYFGAFARLNHGV
jgi:hypothetical protein